jgi:hypothetical protein
VTVPTQQTTNEYIAQWNSYKSLRERLRSGPTPDQFHLITTGHLMASECKQYGFRPMTCGECREHYLDFIYNEGPISWPPIKGQKPYSTVWGKDITPICPCCSFDGCQHRESQKKVSTL